MKSTKARKQRKAFFNAPLHQRRKQIGAHLEENLLLKYDKRRLPVVVGDTVKIMRGASKGHENKVTTIHLKKHLVEVEGVTITKADGKQVAKPVHPSNLLITKLNLTDKWRRQRLEEGLSSETKKEIEKEATDQIQQLEEERKAEEERRKQEEEAAAKEEEEATSVEETSEPTKEPSESKPDEKKDVKKKSAEKPSETKPKKSDTAQKPKQSASKKKSKDTEEKKPADKKSTEKSKETSSKKKSQTSSKEKKADELKEEKK
jgi:large subunit ribosomal protein L24